MAYFHTLYFFNYVFSFTENSEKVIKISKDFMLFSEISDFLPLSLIIFCLFNLNWQENKIGSNRNSRQTYICPSPICLSLHLLFTSHVFLSSEVSSFYSSPCFPNISSALFIPCEYIMMDFNSLPPSSNHISLLP